MKIAYFYLLVLALFFFTKTIVTQESNTLNNREVIAQEIQALFNHAKQDLDILFKHTITTMKEFPSNAKSFQALFDYFSHTVLTQFTATTETIIAAFATATKNLPLFNELREQNALLTQQIAELVNTLTTYKETLKDKLYILIDTFIEDTDLAKKAIAENLGTLNISYEDELQDIAQEKSSAIQEIKNFLSTSVNEFIHQATQGVIEKSVENIFEGITTNK